MDPGKGMGLGVRGISDSVQVITAFVLLLASG